MNANLRKLWERLNTSSYHNQSYLNVLCADVVGAQKHHFGGDTIARIFTSLPCVIFLPLTTIRSNNILRLLTILP